MIPILVAIPNSLICLKVAERRLAKPMIVVREAMKIVRLM